MKMRPRLGGDLEVYAQDEHDPYGPAVALVVRVEGANGCEMLLDSREAYTFAMSVLKARVEVRRAENSRTSPTPTS